MPIRHRSIVHAQRYRPNSRRSCNVLTNNIIRILSTLVIPLMLGLLTICITIYQQEEAKKDRQDDWNVYELQWRADRNESQRHREQELDIAVKHREQELHISKKNQEAQNKIAVNRYQDETFKDYVKEIGDLMKENNGSLTANRLTAALARVKTLNVLRQLDESRQIHLIHFLFEARQFTEADGFIPLDISTAELTNIDFRKLVRSPVIEKISLTGVTLRNCGFGERTQIDHVNFTYTNFDRVNFSFNWLKTVDFSYANLLDLKSSFTKFRTVDFSSATIGSTSFSSNLFTNANFSFTRLKTISYSIANIHNTSFSSANIMDVDFSYATISTTNFTSSTFGNVNFRATSLSNINFSRAVFDTIIFSFARLNGVHFLTAKLIGVNFSSAKLNDVNFSFSRFAVSPPSNFQRAQMANTLFEKCDCRKVDFNYANLSASVFWKANLKNASFQNANMTSVNFFGANLLSADFTNATITDSQLQSALSIRNVKLPNGTLARGRNLIGNGYANCNITSLRPWHVQNGSIAVVTSKEDPTNCQFVLQSNEIGAIMSQRINLIDMWDFTLWTYSEVELHLNSSDGVSIELNSLTNNGTVLSRKISQSMETMIITKLLEDTQKLEVLVNFNASLNNNYTWCDNIELFINYDM